MTKIIVLVCVLALAFVDALDLTVEVQYPSSKLTAGSHNMYLRGSSLGLNWSTGLVMNSAGDDKWQLSLSYDASQAGQSVQLKVVLDDKTWMIGANAVVNLPSDSSTLSLYPWFFSTAGVYKLHRNVYSPQLNNTRDLVIYTPPSYYENTYKTYEDVLVMHDGQNLFNASTSFLGIAWQCQDTVNNLVVTGNMREIVIVGVNNSPDRTDELTYSYDPTQKAGGKGDIYLNFLEQTVMPLAKKYYRLAISGPQNLGIMGSSLGGLISCYAGWTRSNVYGRAGCMSSSFWWNSEDFLNTILAKDPAPKTDGSYLVYLDSGDSGPGSDDKPQTIAVTKQIAALGFSMNQTEFYYLDHGGQHNEYYWGHRFWIPMSDFYPIVPTQTE